MGKIKPHKTKTSKSRRKAADARRADDNPPALLEQATTLLQTGQADDAIPLAQRALELAPNKSPSQLTALSLLAEAYIELGDIDSARNHFTQAAELDPNGIIPESEGGGAEKFLWLAQLSESGGADSVQWFEKGVAALRRTIQQLEEKGVPGQIAVAEEKKRKMANALCGVAEIYMTDLSWEEDAESRCESLITEALMIKPDAPEVLQTLASIRISQQRMDDARAALSRSLEIWKDLSPEDQAVPEFAVRIALSRLLMEVAMELEALTVIERLILEDDQSVEAWYLGGWCLQLLAEKQQAPEEESEGTPESKRHASMIASREWLKQSLKLYDLTQYEDKRLKEHAVELIQEMNKKIGEDMEDDSNDEDEDGEWEDESEGSSDEDHSMADS